MSERLEIIEQYLNRDPLQALAPSKVWNMELEHWLDQCSIQDLFGASVLNADYAKAWQSGLYLCNDSLDKSHSISQDITNETGSYWHGIMHRMEPDYSNAKYWFRKTGKHPAFLKLQDKAKAWLGKSSISEVENDFLRTGLQTMTEQNEWDPYLFIDLIEEQESTGEPLSEAVLKELQKLEIMTLLQFTYNKSCGGTIFESH